MALTAGTPLDVLTSRLEKAGWGDLGHPSMRGLARVLAALASTLNPRTGAGYTTASQLAEKACYTERWVRSRLVLLEELGVIEWHRGGVQGGKPVPSWIRVSKALLADLVAIARLKQGERLAEAKRATRARLARLRASYTQQPGHRKKKPRSDRGSPHAEVSSALLSSEEVREAEKPPSGGVEEQIDAAPAAASTRQSALERIRADLAARRRRLAG